MGIAVHIESDKLQNRWATAATIGISLFAICVFLYPKGYILSSSLLLLISLVAGYYKQLTWHKNLTLLTIVFAIFIFPHLVSLIQGTGTLSDIKKVARGLPLLIAGAFLLCHKPKKEFIYIAFSFGLIVSFLIMINEQISGFDRNNYAGFHINTLMITVVAVLAFILPKTNSRNVWIRFVIYSAFTLTVATLIMSQSKGPSLSLIAVLIVFSLSSSAISNRPTPRSKNNILILWLLMLSTAAITSALTNGALLYRISSASHDVIEHIEVPSESKMSSSATRLELWKGAVILTTEKPLFGYGKVATQNRMVELVNEGRLAKYIQNYTHSHFHSMYFQALGNRGIIGLFSVLLLLIIPGYILLKNRNANPLFAFSGLLVIVNYIVAGAADVALSSTLPSITYFVLIILCVSQVSINRELKAKSAP